MKITITIETDEGFSVHQDPSGIVMIEPNEPPQAPVAVADELPALQIETDPEIERIKAQFAKEAEQSRRSEAKINAAAAKHCLENPRPNTRAMRGSRGIEELAHLVEPMVRHIRRLQANSVNDISLRELSHDAKRILDERLTTRELAVVMAEVEYEHDGLLDCTNGYHGPAEAIRWHIPQPAQRVST